LEVLSRVPAPPEWWGSCGLLILALAFGGGSRHGLWSDAIAQLASLPLIAAAVLRMTRTGVNVDQGIALRLAAAVLLLPVVQLVPMPPGIWTALGGRPELAAVYAEAGVPVPWVGVSLRPQATWRSALSLLPAVSVFLSVLLLGPSSRRALTLALVVFGFVSVLLGLAQLAQGPGSGLRFHSITNSAEAVGFFANRNHFAALLYVILPFAAAWAIGLAADRRPLALVGIMLCLLVLASLLLGLGMARSRAGLVLAMVGGAASLALARTGRSTVVRRRSRRFVLAGSLVGAFLVLQFASLGILQRLQADLAEDLRWELSSATVGIADDFLPSGSGIGSFEAIYRMHEEIDRLRPACVNHAHNDYLELLLEAGWLGIIVMAGFVGWFLFTSVQVWRAPRGHFGSAIDLSLPRAAMIGVVLLCLHSAVDYPLRTTALSSLFALLCALMVPREVSIDHERRGARSGAQ
jgi:O-antigen ligase